MWGDSTGGAKILLVGNINGGEIGWWGGGGGDWPAYNKLLI